MAAVCVVPCIDATVSVAAAEDVFVMHLASLSHAAVSYTASLPSVLYGL